MFSTGSTRRLLSGVCIALFAWTGCGEEEPPPELPPRSILWKEISASEVGRISVISGVVESIDNTKLAFEVGGIVNTVEVELGDQVTEAQILARLDPEPFELAVTDGEAELASVNARIASALADYDRAFTLFKEDVGSQQDLEHAKARRDALHGKIEAAAARLDLAKRDLRNSVLRAPFDGSISVKEIDPAMKVSSGQVVFEADSGESGLRVEVQMPETLITKIKQGDAVEVSFPSSGVPMTAEDDRRYSAIVTEVGTRADTGNAFPVRSNLREAPAWLRSGMSAEVRFETGSRDSDGSSGSGFLIPMAAVLGEADDMFSVFVFDPDSSTLSKRPIRTGGLRGNEILVVAGLEPGQIVATAGVSFLRDGQEVTLLDKRLVNDEP
jgi:multidrug efflux system membrane fusion protein